MDCVNLGSWTGGDALCKRVGVRIEVLYAGNPQAATANPHMVKIQHFFP